MSSIESSINKKEFKADRKSEFFQFLKQLKKNKLAIIGFYIIIFIIIIAILAPIISPYNPNEIDLPNRELKIGSTGHVLGTDDKGRDMLSRLIYGSRVSLLIATASMAVSAFFGILFGLLAGYYKKLDPIIMRIMDVLFAFPGILLALLIVAMMGPGLLNVILAISIRSIPSFARIVRSSVLSVKHMEYVSAVRSLGASDFRIIFGHILPNILSPIIVFVTMRIGRVIISTAALSYLGLGAKPPTAEWGAMISAGRTYVYTSPHISIIPGVAIMLVVFAFNVLGDGVRDALDPSLK